MPISCCTTKTPECNFADCDFCLGTQTILLYNFFPDCLYVALEMAQTFAHGSEECNWMSFLQSFPMGLGWRKSLRWPKVPKVSKVPKIVKLSQCSHRQSLQ